MQVQLQRNERVVSVAPSTYGSIYAITNFGNMWVKSDEEPRWDWVIRDMPDPDRIRYNPLDGEEE